MKTLYVMVSAVAMSAALAGTAGAVDIRDTRSGGGPMRAANLTIMENGQERHITLMSGAVLRNICGDCTIRIGDGDAVHASKDDMVEVRGASLTVRHVPGADTAAARATQESQLPGSAKPVTPATDVLMSVRTGTQDSGAMADPFDALEGGN